MLAFSTEQAGHTVFAMIRRWDEAASTLTPAQQYEWVTVKRRFIEAIYDSAERIMIAQSASDVAVLEESRQQATARLTGWLNAHDIAQQMMIAQSTFDIVNLEENNQQDTALYMLNRWLEAHGVKEVQVVRAYP